MPLLETLAHEPGRPLLFSSLPFLMLFSGFVLAWALLRRRQTARLWLLLGFSYFYYYRCNGVFVLTLVGITVVDWALAIHIARIRPERTRRRWLLLAVALNLSVLGVFKYTNFVLQNGAALLGTKVAPVDIFLPIGLSFLVFQAVSYLVDVHRGETVPTRSPFRFALYLAFFPQLVAGPIVRAEQLLPQIRRLPEARRSDVAAGLYRVVQGIIKKAVLADYLGLYTDLVFVTPAAYSGPEVLLGLYAYTLQIYLDFSAYSDMAVGFAKILGLQVPENFHFPYRATSLREFWARWHMTLSSWLRDYLYIPLGGNRLGQPRQLTNLMVTMLLGGLWHGASWCFVAWGGLHGILLALHRIATSKRQRPSTLPARLLGWLLTFHAVAALWVLFRADSFATALVIYQRLFAAWDVQRLAVVLAERRWLVTVIGLGLLGSLAPERGHRRLQELFVRTPWPVKALVLVAALQALAEVASADIRPFIYFQF